MRPPVPHVLHRSVDCPPRHTEQRRLGSIVRRRRGLCRVAAPPRATHAHEHAARVINEPRYVCGADDCVVADVCCSRKLLPLRSICCKCQAMLFVACNDWFVICVCSSSDGVPAKPASKAPKAPPSSSRIKTVIVSKKQ